ncbi:UNVERIFIED_CONTAM: hypothetical protein RMT77_008539 [Armadillidium vulgare]
MIYFKVPNFFLLLLLVINTIQQEAIYFPDERVQVKEPESYQRCGFENLPDTLSYGFIKTDRGKVQKPIYFLNQTAEELAAKGYQITVHNVTFGDVLTNFSYTNGKEKGHLEFFDITLILAAVGGVNSPVQRSYGAIPKSSTGKVVDRSKGRHF